MKYLMLYLSIFTIFAIFGAMALGTIGHELYHRWDYMDIAKETGSICLIEYPSLNAYYTFNLSKGQAQTFDKKEVNSEIWAYSISIIFLLIMAYCFYKLYGFIFNWGDIDEAS